MRSKSFFGRTLPAQLDGAASDETTEYSAILIGLCAETSTVEQIWVRADGGMVIYDQIHYPAHGRTAAGEAITKFGLFRLQRFPIASMDRAKSYIVKLKCEMKDDAPVIL